MIRWRVIRTLLYKEFLRYRYNWGLLVVVFALIGLAGLISLGGTTSFLPGQTRAPARDCFICYEPGNRWVTFLSRQKPPPGLNILFFPNDRRTAKPPVDHNSISIELFRPGEHKDEQGQPAANYKAKYWYREAAPESIVPYQIWLNQGTYKFLDKQPELAEELHTVTTGSQDVLPLAITGLVAFALYLPAFNLYITSTGEEREKRVLLALLLSPVRPVEIVAAKAIFYVLASLAVSLTVVAMYRPAAVADPRLWLMISLGSLGYVAIGTVVVSYVRRQTTISTVSMLYLMAVGVIMSLAAVSPLFDLLRFLLIENHLYRELHYSISGTRPRGDFGPIALAFLVCCWLLLAVVVFSRNSKSISQAR